MSGQTGSSGARPASAPTRPRQPREPRHQLLDPDRREAHRELRVVSARLDRQHRPHPELGVAHSGADDQTAARRLVFVLVAIRRRFFAHDGGAARRRRLATAVRYGFARDDVAPGRSCHPPPNIPSCRSTSSAGISSRNRDRRARLVLAEHTPPGRPGQHQLALGARHPDVAEAAFLLDVGLALLRARVGEHSFLETGDDDGRELEPLRRVERHQPDARRLRPLLLVHFRQQ